MGVHDILPIETEFAGKSAAIDITIDGRSCEATEDELLVEVINRAGPPLPQVCYHPQLGPIESCDTCLVEVNGELTRACGTRVSPGMTVITESRRAKDAQNEAFNRILGNHLALLHGLRQQQR